MAADTKAQGFTRLRLWVVKDNTRAIRAYAKAGFSATGREKHDEDTRALEIEMARAL